MLFLQVFLSATLSNAMEFAEWVAHLHKQPCHVVYTEFRPTPLKHWAVDEGGEGFHLVSCSGDFALIVLISSHEPCCISHNGVVP